MTFSFSLSGTTISAPSRNKMLDFLHDAPVFLVQNRDFSTVHQWICLFHCCTFPVPCPVYSEIAQSMRSEPSSRACAACFEELAGVFDSSGACYKSTPLGFADNAYIISTTSIVLYHCDVSGGFLDTVLPISKHLKPNMAPLCCLQGKTRHSTSAAYSTACYEIHTPPDTYTSWHENLS